MRVVFDENTANERDIIMDNLTERPLENRITGSCTVNVKGGGQVPDLSAFADNRHFEALRVETSEGGEIPLTCRCNYIADLSATYIEPDGVYLVSMTLTREVTA